jgi:hypothetical protein
MAPLCPPPSFPVRQLPNPLTGRQGTHTQGGVSSYSMAAGGPVDVHAARQQCAGMMGGVNNDPDQFLVQLGLVEVDPKVLAAEGVSLDNAMTGRRLVDALALAEIRDQLPAQGWREVRSDDFGVDQGKMLTLAAPHQRVPDTWVLAYLSERDDQWLFSASPEPNSVWPGKAFRRRHLRLTWPRSPIVASAGRVPELAVTVTNTAAELWRGMPGDNHAVVAWIVDAETGERLTPQGWFAYGGADTAELAARESKDLVAILATYGADELPPGEYGLEAVLLTLDLRSDRGHLRLT